MKRRRIVLILVLLVLGAQFLPKGKTNPDSDPSTDITVEASLRPEIREIFERSCFDCHSNSTQWPWYANVTPVGQWLVHHVDEARHHLDFSVWTQLSEWRRAKVLEEIGEEVGGGHMPLRSYLWLHGEARLSDEERERIVSWSQERRSEIEQKLQAID